MWSTSFPEPIGCNARPWCTHQEYLSPHSPHPRTLCLPAARHHPHHTLVGHHHHPATWATLYKVHIHFQTLPCRRPFPPPRQHKQSQDAEQSQTQALSALVFSHNRNGIKQGHQPPWEHSGRILSSRMHLSPNHWQSISYQQNSEEKNKLHSGNIDLNHNTWKASGKHMGDMWGFLWKSTKPSILMIAISL